MSKRFVSCTFRRTGCILCLGATLVVTTVLNSYASDEKRLWLPVKYQPLYLSLVKAAETAEAIERCVSVVEGTIDLEQSEPEHPIYKILCRQENGRTYNEMVDGVSFATLTTPKVVEPVLTEEEKERQRALAEERRQQEIAKHKKESWELCLVQLRERTKLMLDLVWLREMDTLLEPDVYTEEEVSYSVGFDARSMWQEPLHYSAECVVRGEQAEVTLRKR